MRRAVERYSKDPLAENCSVGPFKPGDKVEVVAVDGSYRSVPESQRADSAAGRPAKTSD